jgi:hypothetical protein
VSSSQSVGWKHASHATLHLNATVRPPIFVTIVAADIIRGSADGKLEKQLLFCQLNGKLEKKSLFCPQCHIMSDSRHVISRR